MNGYLVLVRGGGKTFESLSEEKRDEIYAKWNAYIEKLTESGHWLKGQPIEETGRLLCEKKEAAEGVVGDLDVVVVGYFILEAANYDEAVKLCLDCPSLEVGGKLEIRQTVEM